MHRCGCISDKFSELFALPSLYFNGSGSICTSPNASASISVDVVPLQRFGGGNGDILLDNVVCRGNESSLLECSTNPIRQHNCDHSEDAGVMCEGKYPIHKTEK